MNNDELSVLRVCSVVQVVKWRNLLTFLLFGKTSQDKAAVLWSVNPYNAEICVYKPWKPKGSFILKSSLMS